ncbi:MAG: pyruvate formate lyase-activating protein [Clostridiales bacterium]|nr:pyruvate formate lyase-activating protein [Clostridiales bacterium]
MMECNRKTETGNIHSLESFGTVDGPGTRFVVFFQGCPMRCQYCHNPDTWEPGKGKVMDVDEILSIYEKNKNFYRNGGITATGGEPLLQLGFLTELFREAKKRGIHTCLDTSGITYNDRKKEEFQELFSCLDLVLLDFKHSDPQGHKELTKQSQEPVLKFAHALEKAQIPMIVRHVVVPGITDGKAHLERLGEILASFRNLKGLEVLPYHTMGTDKYKVLGISYPLEGVEAMGKEQALEARDIILKKIREMRRKPQR